MEADASHYKFKASNGLLGFEFIFKALYPQIEHKGNARCLASSHLHFYFDTLSLILFQHTPAHQSLFLFIP